MTPFLNGFLMPPLSLFVAFKVLEGLKPFTGKGKVLRTSLTKDKEHELHQVIEGVG